MSVVVTVPVNEVNGIWLRFVLQIVIASILIVAAYDPQVDHSVDDVLIHTDHLMYAEKRAKKKKTKS